VKASKAIKSTFSTVRLRTRVTTGPHSRSVGLAMAHRLLLESGTMARRNGPYLVALVFAESRAPDIEARIPR